MTNSQVYPAVMDEDFWKELFEQDVGFWGDVPGAGYCITSEDQVEDARAVPSLSPSDPMQDGPSPTMSSFNPHLSNNGLEEQVTRTIDIIVLPN